MSVSSKWYVTKIEGQQVHLYPVCRGVENREWSSATPGGSMQMTITNPAALEQFVVGEEYLARFDFAPKPKPGDGHEVDVVEQYGWDPQTGKNDKVYWVCGTCGSYARLTEDGKPDWTAHEEMFGR